MADAATNPTVYRVVTSSQRTYSAAVAHCASLSGWLAPPSDLAKWAYQQVFGGAPSSVTPVTWTNACLNTTDFIVGPVNATMSSPLRYLNGSNNEGSPLFLWNASFVPAAPPSFGNCFGYVNNTNIGMAFQDENTPATFICARSMAQMWFSVNRSMFEFTVVTDVKATYNRSDQICRALGGGLAYFPKSLRVADVALFSTAFSAPGNPHLALGAGLYPLRIGISVETTTDPNPWKSRNQSYMDEDWFSIPDYYTEELPGITTAVITSVNSSMVVFVNASGATPLYFMCSRPTAITANAVPCAGSVDLIYRMLPPAIVPRAAELCAKALGNVTKFAFPSDLGSCFSNASLARVVTPIKNKGGLPEERWIDGSLLPVNAAFFTGTYTGLFYFTTSNVETPIFIRNENLEFSAVPAICEYNTSLPVAAGLSIPSPPAIEIGLTCGVEVVVSISRPLVPGTTVMVCPNSTMPGSKLAPLSCLTWNSTTSAGAAYALSRSIVVRQIGSGSVVGGDTLGFNWTCVPASLCPSVGSGAAPLLPNISVSFTSGSAISLRIGDGQVTNSVQAAGSPGESIVVDAGTPFPIVFDWSVGTPPATTQQHDVQLSISSTNTVVARLCNIFPNRMTVGGGSASPIEVQLFCSGGPNGTAFKVLSRVVARNESNKCLWGPFDGVIADGVVRSRGTVGVTSALRTIAPFSVPLRLDLSFQGANMRFPNRTSPLRDYLCFGLLNATIPGVTIAPACWTGPNNMSLYVTMPTDINLQSVTPKFSIVLSMLGSASNQYLWGVGLPNVTLTVVPWTFRVAGLLPTMYYNDTVSVSASIPYQVPNASFALNLQLTYVPPASCTSPGFTLTEGATGWSSQVTFDYPTVQLPVVAACQGTWTTTAVLQGSIGTAPWFQVAYVAPYTGTFKLVDGSIVLVDPLVPKYFYLGASFNTTFRLLRNVTQMFQASVLLDGQATSNYMSVTPSVLTWDLADIYKVYNVTFTPMAKWIGLHVTFSRNNNQYTLPPDRLVSIFDPIEISVFPPRFVTYFFPNVTYYALVDFKSIPLDETVTLQLTCATPNILADVGPAGPPTLVVTNSTNVTSSLLLPFTIHPKAPVATDVVLTVVINGSLAYATKLLTPTITLSSILLKVNITASPPLSLLVTREDQAGQGNISLSLTRETRTCTLTVFATSSVNLTVTPSSVQWSPGNALPKVFSVRTQLINAQPDPDAYVNLTAVAEPIGGQRPGSPCDEVNSFILPIGGVLVIPIQVRGTVSASWGSSNKSVTLNRPFPMGLLISQPPRGDLSLKLEASVPGSFDFSPPSVTITPTSALNATILVIARTLNAGLVRIFVTLLGAAAPQFSTERMPAYFVSVGPEVRPQIAPWGSSPTASPIVVGEENAVDVFITVSDAPSADAPVTYDLTVSNPSALSIEPRNVTFTDVVTSASVRLTAKINTSSPVGLNMNPVGLAPGYTSETRAFDLIPRAVINVTFPTQRVYIREPTSFTIDLGRAVVSRPSTEGQGNLAFSVNFICVMCLDNTSVDDGVRFYAERESVKTVTVDPPIISPERLVGLTNSTIVLVTVVVTIQASRSRFQYIYPNSSNFTAVVPFLPSRTVQIVRVPSVIFWEESTDITLRVSEAPESPDGILSLVLGFHENITFDTGMVPATWNAAAPLPTFPDEVGGITDPARVLALLERNVTFRLSKVKSSASVLNVTVLPKEARPAYMALRYTMPAPMSVPIVEKLQVSTTPSILRPFQVVGVENQQLVNVTLSRAPFQRTTLSLYVDGAYPNMVTATPETFVFEANVPPPTVPIRIIGNIVGEVTDVRFVLSGWTKEIAASATQLALAPVLEIRQLGIITLSASTRLVYVGTPNVVTVTLSTVPTSLVNISLAFSEADVIEFTPPTLIFDPSVKTTTLTATFVGLRPFPLGGALEVRRVLGSEFLESISGEVRFTVLPKVTAVFRLASSLLANDSVITLSIDEPVKLSVELTDELSSEIPEAKFTVSFVPAVLSYPKILVVSNNFTFARNGNPQATATLAGGGLTAFNATLLLSPPHRTEFAPGYSVPLRIVPGAAVTVVGLPAVLFEGSDNARTASIVLVRNITGATVLQIDITVDCGARLAYSVSRPLVWSATVTAPVSIRVSSKEGNPGPCRIAARRAIPNDYLSVLDEFFATTIEIRASPSVAIVVPTDKLKLLAVPEGIVYDSPWSMQATFAAAMAGQVVFTVNVANGFFFNDTQPSFTFITADQRGELPNSTVLIYGDRTLDEEPAGLVASALTKCPNLITGQFQGSGSIVVSMKLCDGVAIVEGETLNFTFTRHAFQNLTSPKPLNRTVQVSVSKKPLEPSKAADRKATSALATVGMLAGMAFAPTMSFNPERTYALISLVVCPNNQRAFTLIEGFGVSLGEQRLKVPGFSTSYDLLFALSVQGIGAAVVLLHLLVALGFHFQRKAGSTRTILSTFAKVRFPGLSVVVSFALLQPTVEAAMHAVLYAPSLEYRFGGVALLIIPVILIPLGVSAVALRNRSLQFHETSEKELRDTLGIFRSVKPSGFWTHPSPDYVPRYAAFFADNREALRWFVIFDLALCIASGIIMSTDPTTKRFCVIKAAALTTVIGLLCVAMVLWRPKTRSFVNGAFAVVYGLQFAGAVIMTYETAQPVPSDSRLRSAVAIIVTSSVLLMLIGVWLLVSDLIENVVRQSLDRVRTKEMQNGLLDDDEAQRREDGSGEVEGVAPAPAGDGDADDVVAKAGAPSVPSSIPAEELEAKSKSIADESGGAAAKSSNKKRTAKADGGLTKGLYFIDEPQEAGDSDDSDDALDVALPPALDQALDHLEQHGDRPAAGVFRCSTVGEFAYSPMRRQELKQREAELKARKVNEDAEHSRYAVFLATTGSNPPTSSLSAGGHAPKPADGPTVHHRAVSRDIEMVAMSHSPPRERGGGGGGPRVDSDSALRSRGANGVAARSLGTSGASAVSRVPNRLMNVPNPEEL